MSPFEKRLDEIRERLARQPSVFFDVSAPEDIRFLLEVVDWVLIERNTLIGMAYPGEKKHSNWTTTLDALAEKEGQG